MPGSVRSFAALASPPHARTRQCVSNAHHLKRCALLTVEPSHHVTMLDSDTSCNQTGKPTWHDPLEPLRVANQVKRMGLRHAVITSVDRDDLPDYGAGAFVGVIRSIRRMAPGCKVEVLTPDFRGQEMPLAKVIAERPDVFNHNVETVPRLYPMARRGSDFLRSARVLRMAKEMAGDEVVTKSGLMVGLGEEFDEMVEAFSILRDHGVQVLTVGPVPAADGEAPAGRPLLAPGRVRSAGEGGLRAGIRVRRLRGRWSAPVTTRTSSCRRRARGRGPLNGANAPFSAEACFGVRSLESCVPADAKLLCSPRRGSRTGGPRRRPADRRSLSQTPVDATPAPARRRPTKQNPLAGQWHVDLVPEPFLPRQAGRDREEGEARTGSTPC